MQWNLIDDSASIFVLDSGKIESVEELTKSVWVLVKTGIAVSFYFAKSVIPKCTVYKSAIPKNADKTRVHFR